MPAHVVLFEDEGYKNLYPLTLNHPVYSLRCGIALLGEKIRRAYRGATAGHHVRTNLASFLEAYLRKKKDDPQVNECRQDKALLVNGRALFSQELAEQIPVDGPDTLYMKGDVVVAARLSGAKLAAVDWNQPITLDRLPSISRTETDAAVIIYPWDLVHQNGEEITREFKTLAKPGEIEGTVYDNVYILGRENVYIAAGAKVKPGVVIDAEDGPVFIDENAKIFPNAVIEGPAYVGKKTAIKIAAKIYEGTSLGPVCKVGGEVEECIIHSYSNKQHEGFLGHAYIGRWVNLGADTNNSDLKNDYGNVRVTVGDKEIDTGSQFVGCTIGDHSKTGINSMLNTGTVIGLGCNLYGAGFPPKYVPSFSWGGAEGLVEYRIDKFIQVAKRVMARRGIELDPEEEDLLRKIHEMTADERRAAGVRQ